MVSGISSLSVMAVSSHSWCVDSVQLHNGIQIELVSIGKVNHLNIGRGYAVDNFLIVVDI